jgi:type IV pilus assembly protein PilB
MAERRTIGQILMSFGRITEEDVERAIDYQREEGGYFGEALLAMGFVSQEELEWGLASQFDLPYVFPEADSIDPEAAALVSPEWALAHLTLPIMMTDETLTVIVDSPIRTGAVDELQARTDREIDLALASSAKIRELIRQIYARAVAQEDIERPVPASVTELFHLALDAGSPKFGISTRNQRVWGWYDDAGHIRRRPLEGMWARDLQELISPPPEEEIGEQQRHRYTGHMNRDGIVTPVEVRYFSDETGSEYLLRPVQERSVLQERFTPPTAGILSEIRLLARSGSARFILTSEPDGVGEEILPHLPVMLLDPSWRSIYVNDHSGDPAGEAFSTDLAPGDFESWKEELETLRVFHFDIVTVDLDGPPEEWLEPVLDIASVAFVRWGLHQDRRPAHDAGIRWELRIDKKEGDRLEWTLEPLHG